MSFVPIITWFLLGITVDKNLINIFTLTYPLQFIYSLLKSAFGISPNIYALKEKNNWLNKYLPELPIEKRIFVPYGDVKYKYLPSKITSFDYLIDDHTKNLLDWKEAGGTGIKFLNGINHIKGIWQGLLLREDENISKNFKWILDNCYKETDKSFELNNIDEEYELEI